MIGCDFVQKSWIPYEGLCVVVKIIFFDRSKMMKEISQIAV